MKNSAVAVLAFLILVLGACASSDARRDARDPFPETPDPAGARRLAGDWVFSMKVADHEIDGKLHFSYDGTFLAGSFTDMSGVVLPLADIRASKDRMAWKLADDRGTEQLAGSFAGDGTLSGTMTRVRRRESKPQGDASGEGDTPPDEPPRGHGGGRHHGGGGHGGGRSGGASSAKWSAVPAAKSDSPAGGRSQSSDSRFHALHVFTPSSLHAFTGSTFLIDPAMLVEIEAEAIVG